MMTERGLETFADAECFVEEYYDYNGVLMDENHFLFGCFQGGYSKQELFISNGNEGLFMIH